MIHVISSKNAYAAKRLLKEAGIMSAKSPKRNLGGSASGGNQILKILDLKWLIGHGFRILVKRGDVLYVRNPYLNGKPHYLSQIIKLAQRFKAQGGRVVDGNITKGDLGLGKWVDYQKLKKIGLSIPKTKLLKSYPLTTTHYPLILKWIYGMKAKGTFLVFSSGDLKRIPSWIPKKELMLQEYIKADYEYKIITVGYKALPVVLRFKIKDSGFLIDFKKHQTVKKTNVLAVCRLAEKASKVLGRELAKVDILEKEGKFYILEVNRFPGLESFERLTKYDVIKLLVGYLQKK